MGHDLEMLTSKAVWEVIAGHAPRGEWLTSAQIYSVVEDHGNLDASDRVAVSEKSASPRWKRTVRNALQRQKQAGGIEWDGKGKFRLP